MVRSTAISTIGAVGWRLVLAAALPPTAALGGYLLPLQIAGVQLYPFKVLVIAGILLHLLSSRGRFSLGTSETKSYWQLGCIWLFWGLGSLFWTPQLATGVSELLFVAFGFLTAFSLWNLVAQEQKGLHAIRLGWVLAYATTGGVAVWEFFTGHHLPGYFADYASQPLLDKVVFSTFGNPNNYSAFLVLAFPFLWWSVLLARGGIRLFYLLLVIALPFLMVMSGGRLAIIAVACQLVLILLMSVRDRKTTIIALALAGILGIGLLLAVKTDNTALVKLASLQQQMKAESSVDIRLNLMRNGLLFFRNSYGMGVGAGGFEYMMEHGFGQYPTASIINPHNFWIEVLSQYGAVVFVTLVIWLARLGRIGFRTRSTALKNRDMETLAAANALLVGLLGYLPAAAEHSNYITQFTNWAFLASLLVVSSYLSQAPRGGMAVRPA